MGSGWGLFNQSRYLSRRKHDLNFREVDMEPREIYNPHNQHLYHCLAQRAVAPGRVLPDVSSSVLAHLRPPPSLVRAAAEPLAAIDRLFRREVVETKKEKVTGDKLFGGNTKRSADNEDGDGATTSKQVRLKGNAELSLSGMVTEVGTGTPVEDFQAMLRDGERLITGKFTLGYKEIHLTYGSIGDKKLDFILNITFFSGSTTRAGYFAPIACPNLCSADDG